MCDACFIFIVALSHNFFFVTKKRLYNHKISNVAQTVRYLLVITKCFHHRVTCGKGSRLRLKCDGTRAETRFRLSAKRTSQFKSAEASVQSTTGSRDVRISSSNAGYTMFRGSVKSTGYPLHSPVSPSLPLPCVTVYHHVSTGLLLVEVECCGLGVKLE
jgi:hypothetical protein